MLSTDAQKVKFIFHVLHKTQTPISMFAELTGISRQTFHHWKRGGEVNDFLRLNIAVRTAKDLDAIAQRRLLPRHDMPAADRLHLLKQMVTPTSKWSV